LPAVPKALVTVNITDTNWTAGWKKIKSLRADSLELKCVEKGGSCIDPAVGVASDNLPPRATEATVTGLYPGTEYTCYLITETKKSQKCSKPVSVKTTYTTRVYIDTFDVNSGRRRLLVDSEKDTEVCNVDSEGGFINCIGAQLGEFMPYGIGVSAAAVGSTYRWISFLDENSRTKMYTCPLNPDGTAVSDACKNVFTAPADGHSKTSVFNEQSTKVWILCNEPINTIKGSVCDIDANGDYETCMDFENDKVSGKIVPSPDGQSVYVVSDAALYYCTATVQDCQEVDYMLPGSFIIPSKRASAAFGPSVLGFQSSRVALLALIPLITPKDLNGQNGALGSVFLRCNIESPTEFDCEEYGSPFTMPTFIFGFAFANNGANVYIGSLTISMNNNIKSDTTDELLRSAAAEGVDIASISQALSSGNVESIANLVAPNDFGVKYCTMGADGIKDCVKVLDFLAGNEIVAFTKPIIV